MDFGTYFDALERGSHHFHGTFIPANTHVSALNRIKGLYHEAANTPNSTKHRNRKARQLLARIAGLGDFILLLSVVCIPVAWMVKITATDSFIAQLQQWKVGISVTDEQDSQASSILAQYSITVQTDVSTTTDKALHAEHAPRLGTQAQEQQSDNSDANDPSSIRGADDGDGVDLGTLNISNYRGYKLTRKQIRAKCTRSPHCTRLTSSRQAT